MQQSALIGTIVAALFLGSANALAGPGKTARGLWPRRRRSGDAPAAEAGANEAGRPF